MSILKTPQKGFLYTGAVYLLIGLFMCVWPVGTAGVICVIAGAVLMGSGAVKAVGYFRKKEYSLIRRMDFASSALLIILGILLAGRPDIFMSLVPFLLGMMILVSSVFQMQIALELHSMKFSSWWHHLTIALICGILAIVMMFDPFQSYRIVAVFMGLAFIADGAADLYTGLYLMKRLKKLELM